jgi:hypothetical protein
MQLLVILDVRLSDHAAPQPQHPKQHTHAAVSRVRRWYEYIEYIKNFILDVPVDRIPFDGPAINAYRVLRGAGVKAEAQRGRA